METIIFNNEHLWIGNLGKISVILAFVTSIASFIFYALSTKESFSHFKKLGKHFFYIHSISVVLIFFTLFYIIHSHYYEYQYAYQHSSNELPIYYMISCFWEGQEGSFLLWMFWHCVIGIILIKKSGEWESGVLTVIGLAQFILGSMLLGFEIEGLKIGSSPFILMREHNPEMLLIPALESVGKENYLQIFKNGNGLNPLLQNYWMVIHPPTLFFGFAATIVPFAFCFTGLWLKKYREWIVPALPWSLIAVLVLGVGIIMGGYWAYESLSFGGYWAWDPVENASLMPWLMLITSLHLLIIFKVTKKYPVFTIVTTVFSFFLVLYATFLTRSGILGNASVHSFTDLGLSGQLILLLFSFIILTYSLTFQNKKQGLIFFIVTLFLLMFFSLLNIQDKLWLSILGTVLIIGSTAWFIVNLFKIFKPDQSADSLYSREFWMLTGSLVLLLSGIHIFVFTSLPVFNQLFGWKKAVKGPEFYNQWQIWFAVLISILSGFAQFLRYKNTDSKKFIQTLLNSSIISLALTLGAMFLFQIFDFKYLVLLLTSIFLIVSNFYVLITIFKGKIKYNGASVAHVGFGLILLGVLVSSVKQNVISNNQSGTKFYSEKNESGHTDEKGIENNKNNVLMIQNRAVYMANNTIRATYKGNKTIEPNKYFHVHYEVLDKNGKVKDTFNLFPNSQNNPKMGLVSNPDTRHYLTRDIFTHINYESEMDEKKEDENFDNFKTDTLRINETAITKDGFRTFTLTNIENLGKDSGIGNLFLRASIKVNLEGDTTTLFPELIISGKTSRIKEALDIDKGILLVFDKIYVNPYNPKDVAFVISSATKKPKYSYIILKAIEFPFINILWLGTFVLIFGFSLSIVQRFKEVKL